MKTPSTWHSTDRPHPNTRRTIAAPTIYLRLRSCRRTRKPPRLAGALLDARTGRCSVYPRRRERRIARATGAEVMVSPARGAAHGPIPTKCAPGGVAGPAMRRLRPRGESETERAPLGISADRPPRPGMDHATAQRGDLLERGLHMGHSEIRQRGRVPWAGATLVNA